MDIFSAMFYWDLADIVEIILGSNLNKHGAGMRDDEMGFGNYNPYHMGIHAYIYNTYIVVGGLVHEFYFP